MFVRDGKLVVAAEAVTSVAHSSRRVFVTEVRTGRRFLVDLGAEISVLPPAKGAPKTSGIVLTAANGTQIQTYGPKTLQLDFGLSRCFAWTFEMAEVPKPIIGADFLHYFGLLVDVKRSRIIVPNHNKPIKATMVSDKSAPLFTVSRSPKWVDILLTFPSVTRESPVPGTFLHDVVHELNTTGPPLFARQRRFPPDRAQARSSPRIRLHA